MVRVLRVSRALILILAVLASVAEAGAAFGQVAAQPPDDPVTVREFGASRAIVREVIGPYWRVGGVLRDVAAYRDAVAPRTTLFVRFLSDPMQTPPTSLHTLVGFEVEQILPVVESSFSAADIPAGRAVCVPLPAGAGLSMRRISDLLRRVAEHGYTSLGPIEERYASPADPDGTPGELRVWIAPSQPRRDEAPVTARDDHPRAPAPTPSPPEARAPSPSAALEEPEAAPPAGPGDLPGQGDPPGRPAAEPVVESPAGVEVPPARCGVLRAIAAGDGEHVAEMLLPPAGSLSEAERGWLHAVMVHLQLVEAVLSRDAPDDDDPVLASLGVVVTRYERWLEAARIAPGDLVLLRWDDAGSDETAVRRRALVNRLRTLVGQLTFGVASPDQVRAEIPELLQAACELLPHPPAGDSDPAVPVQPPLPESPDPAARGNERTMRTGFRYTLFSL
jgi:hypothetical protein